LLESLTAAVVIPEMEVAKKAARWRTRSGGRLRLSGTGPIGTAPGLVAGVFAAQGAVRSAQNSRQRARRLSLGQAKTHGLTVFSTQVCVVSFCHGNTLALQGL